MHVPNAPSRPAAVEKALLQHALWVFAGVTLVMAVMLTSLYLLAAVVLCTLAAYAVWSYKENEVRQDFRAPVSNAWNAAIRAMGENGCSYGDQTWHGPTDARVKGSRASVHVERHPGNVTRVRVRVGLFNSDANHRHAALILESLARELL